MEGLNTTSASDLASFSASLMAQIKSQQDIISRQEKEIELFKVKHIKAQNEFVANMMEGIGKLMNEQNSKIITMTTKAYEQQQRENEEVQKIAGENEIIVMEYVEKAKEGGDVMGGLIKEAMENDEIVIGALGDTVKGVEVRNLGGGERTREY
jgi:predicted phage tail protein